MRLALTLTVLAICVAGCAAPVEATRDLPHPRSLDQVNLLLRGKRVSIELWDGTRIPLATGAVVTPYDVRFEIEKEPRAIPVTDVARITSVGTRGSRTGALVGAMPGLATMGLGAGVVAFGNDSVVTGLAGLFLILSGGIATLAGAPIGSVLGRNASPGDAVSLYRAPVERYLAQPESRNAR